MDGLENSALMSEVRSRHEPKSADESGAQVRNDVTVEVLHEQNVVLIWIHHQLHAGVVDDVLAIRNLRIFLRNIPRAAQEESVRQLHDVGLVDGMNLLAMILACVFKCKTGNAR